MEPTSGPAELETSQTFHSTADFEPVSVSESGVETTITFDSSNNFREDASAELNSHSNDLLSSSGDSGTFGNQSPNLLAGKQCS